LDIFAYYAHAQLQVAKAISNGNSDLVDLWQATADMFLNTLFACMFLDMTQQ
jgi:hypothetical protein